MGMVIEFPTGNAGLRTRPSGAGKGRCEVVILPVIRIDRYGDAPAKRPVLQPANGGERGNKRRKRASRS